MGGPSGAPVIDMSPENAWAIRSKPTLFASGPVRPNAEIDAITSRGFRFASDA